MSLGNTTENDFLLLFFNNTNDANVGDATGLRGSTTAGSFYVALHSADPGETGDQTTSEVSWTGYSRQAVARSSGGFTVTANQVVNAALISFGARTDVGSTDVLYWSIGINSSGASKIICYGYAGDIATRLFFTGKASTDVVTVPGHSLSVGDTVVAFPTVGATLPTGLTEGAKLFVKTVSGNDITLSTTSGGATLDLTADGAGAIAKLVPLTVTQNVTPQFASGVLKFSVD